MDISDIVWYNTGMNDLVKVVPINPREEEVASGHLEIIVPSDYADIGYDGGKIKCMNGEILVIPAGCPFSVLSCGGGAHTVVMEQPVVSVKKPLLLGDDLGHAIVLAAKQAKKFLHEPNDGCGAILAALGNLIAGYINYANANGKNSPVTQKIIEDIEKNYADQSFSVEDCLSKLPLNYDYVRKLFKKETGVTPHEYLVSKRMERAQALLLGGITNRYSNYSVSQIAELCGFSEPLYFSRVFKKYFGVSPTEYKK